MLKPRTEEKALFIFQTCITNMMTTTRYLIGEGRGERCGEERRGEEERGATLLGLLDHGVKVGLYG